MKLKFAVENERKIEILCRDYYQIVYDHCFFSLINRSIASDITHDTFLRAFRNIDNIVLDSNVKYYLFKIADNLIIDYYRREKKEQISAMNYSQEEIENESSTNKIRYLTKEQIINKLRKVIDLEDIKLLTMVYIEKQSYKQIAKELNLTKTQIDNRIRRAKRIIKKTFKKSDFEY